MRRGIVLLMLGMFFMSLVIVSAASYDVLSNPNGVRCYSNDDKTGVTVDVFANQFYDYIIEDRGQLTYHGESEFHVGYDSNYWLVKRFGSVDGEICYAHTYEHIVSGSLAGRGGPTVTCPERLCDSSKNLTGSCQTDCIDFGGNYYCADCALNCGCAEGYYDSDDNLANGCDLDCNPSCDVAVIGVALETHPCGQPIINACGDTCEEVTGTYCDTGSTCTSGACVPDASISSAYWTDMQGTPLQSGHKIEKGDSVYMSVEGVNLETHAANFSLYKDSVFVLWDLGSWFADAVLIDSLSTNEVTLTSEGDYYFVVDVPSLGISSERSLTIRVSNEVDNDQMTLDFSQPNCGSNYTTDTAVEVVVDITDVDDLVTGNLTIGGEVIALTNGRNTVTRTFPDAGEYSLVAYAESRGNGIDKSRIRKISNIIVTDSSDGNYTAACIDQPDNYQQFSNNTINFVATSTRAISCSGGGCTVITPEDNSEDILFNWTFPNDSEMPNFERRGNETEGGLVGYNFTANFARPGLHVANLEVSFA